MVYRRLVPSGNVVTLEAPIVDQSRPGWELSWCGIDIFDGEGCIISDHSYLNRKRLARHQRTARRVPVITPTSR